MPASTSSGHNHGQPVSRSSSVSRCASTPRPRCNATLAPNAAACSAPAEAAVKYFERRQELKQQLALAKLEGDIAVEKARAEYRVKDLEYDNAWELEQIRNSGWKDEYVLVLLSIPLILVFVPFAQPYVLEGFNVLEQCPDWYRWLVVMIFAATYGIRVWRRQGSPTE